MSAPWTSEWPPTSIAATDHGRRRSRAARSPRRPTRARAFGTERAGVVARAERLARAAAAHFAAGPPAAAAVRHGCDLASRRLAALTTAGLHAPAKAAPLRRHRATRAACPNWPSSSCLERTASAVASDVPPWRRTARRRRITTRGGRRRCSPRPLPRAARRQLDARGASSVPGSTGAPDAGACRLRRAASAPAAALATDRRTTGADEPAGPRESWRAREGGPPSSQPARRASYVTSCIAGSTSGARRCCIFGRSSDSCMRQLVILCLRRRGFALLTEVYVAATHAFCRSEISSSAGELPFLSVPPLRAERRSHPSVADRPSAVRALRRVARVGEQLGRRRVPAPRSTGVLVGVVHRGWPRRCTGSAWRLSTPHRVSRPRLQAAFVPVVQSYCANS